MYIIHWLGEDDLNKRSQFHTKQANTTGIYHSDISTLPVKILAHTKLFQPYQRKYRISACKCICVQNKKKEGKKKHGSHSLDLSTHRRHSQFLGLIYCILAPPLNCTSSCVFKLQKQRAQYTVPSYFYFPCAYFPFLSSLSFSISYKFEVNFSFF